MSSLLGENIPCGIYRFIDDVSDFKIRICIQKSGSPCLQNIESSDRGQQGQQLGLPKQKNALCVEQTFSWQEKVSKLEERELSSSSICMANSGANGSDGLQLFTYVDSEIRKADFMGGKDFEISKEDMNTKSTRISHLNKTFQKSFILDEKDIIQITKNKKCYGLPSQLMSVMAIIDKDENSGECEEVQLCFITRYSSGVFIISPDFNTSKYYIQNRSLEIFEYVIQNASKEMNKVDAEKEAKFIKQIALQHEKVIVEAVGGHFELPQSDTVLLLLNGEVVSAQGFDCKYAFVRYNFQVCDGFLAENDENSHGATQTCKLKKKNTTLIADYSHPFTFKVPIDLQSLKKQSGLMPKVKLIVEVISVDYWGIFRNEGYGFCSVVLSPGSRTYQLSTWKLLPQTIHEALTNFFIGGTPCLENTDYITVPEQLQGSFLGKLGAKTENSGSVTIKIDLILHFGCETSTYDLVH